jgi:hypothetical protein
MYSAVCQLTVREKRHVYPRVMALHAMRDYSGGGALGTNAVFQHLRAAKQPLLEQSVPFRKKRKIEREEVTGGDIEKDRKRDRSRLCGRWAERWRRVESAHFSPVQGTTRYTVKKRLSSSRTQPGCQ